MPDLKEQGKNIGRKIRLYTEKKARIDFPKVDDQPTLWRKQDFIAEVLLYAYEQKYYAPSRDVLQEIKDEFTKETKLEVNIDTLFEKEWLRTITDIVCMPAAIRGSIYSVRKIKNCKNEILFLRTVKKDNYGVLSTIEFEKLTKQYHQENAIELNIEKAVDAHLLSIDKDKVKLNNIAYYNPIIDNWNEFLFLAFFYDKIQGEYSNLIISKDKLTSLHEDHFKKYALTPTLSEMLSSGLGLGIDGTDEYIISLFQERYCSDETLDEEGAMLWRKLNTTQNMSQEKLLKTWFRKMIIKGGHKSDIHKYLINHEKDQFNKAAVTVIMQEIDLKVSHTEYKKALLDYYLNHDLLTLQLAERLTDYKLVKDSKDAFDTMTAISIAQRGTTDDYLYFAQSCRETISYLIRQIVKSHSCENFQIGNINALTEDIHQKPYLLWTICFWLWELRPELLPALMLNTRISSAIFSLVKKITISPHTFESSSEIKFRITSTLFKHLLNILQLNEDVSQEEKAKIIFDCLLTITTPQFQIKGQTPKHQRENQDEAIRLAETVRSEFANRPNQYSIYNNHIHTNEKYYSALLKDLFALINELIQENKYDNRSLDFHYEKILFLIFLSKLSKDIPSKNKLLRLDTYELSKSILDCYTNTISATNVLSLDSDTWEQKEATPILSAAFQNIESIDWATAYLLLEEENLSSRFLNPANLTFNDSRDEYDDFNRFIIHKLRAHLKVLMVTYAQLKDREPELRQRGVQIPSILIPLQNAILDIAIPFSINEPLKRRFDIFNNIDERPTFVNQQGELLPELGVVANHFAAPEREKLINALLRTDTLIRVLKLIEIMSSEQDQMFLLTYLNTLKLQEELKKLSLNDFQFLLSNLSKHSQFQDKARAVLSYWEVITESRKSDFLSNEITATTYRTKLLLAYQANDLKSIEEVPEPGHDIYINITKLYPRNEKDFYKALYHFNNDNPEEAYSLYNDLIYRKDDDTISIALNRFASKLKWAEKENEVLKKNILFSEALNEWDNYQENLPSDTSLESIAEKLLYNRLVALNALEKFDEFDNAYSALNFIDRVKPGYFKIGVRNRLTRKMDPEALGLIKDATEFHKLKDGTIPDFVKEMNNLVVEKNDPETLKNLFSTVLGANPAALVKLIPDSINDGNDPISYILNYIIDTASDMLSKINSVAEVSFEDKYSDLMIWGLNNSMKFHYWGVSPARGGFSDSKLNNPGEIDFKVCAGNGEELAICEALNLNGENNYEVSKHSIKIFNYTPSKQGLFLIVYYKGPEKNFLKSWEKYKNSIQYNVDFPESYQIVNGSFIDSSNKHNLAAVRVGNSSHGQGITLHHVFININYKAIVEKVD
jgi:hypothetical protein